MNFTDFLKEKNNELVQGFIEEEENLFHDYCVKRYKESDISPEIQTIIRQQPNPKYLWDTIPKMPSKREGFRNIRR